MTLVAQFSPVGYEFMFFSLASLTGRCSSFVGPFVSQAIADDTGNASTPFYFLLALSLVSCVLLWPLDTNKAKLEQARFIEFQARDKHLNKSDLGAPTDVISA